MWRIRIRRTTTNLMVIIMRIIIVMQGLPSPAAVVSMRMELVSGTSKCITEDIKHNDLTVGKYSVVNPNVGYPLPDTHKITVRVTSPYGNNYHHSSRGESGTFAFTSGEGGDYMLCFWAPAHKPSKTLSIELEWQSGFAAREWSNIARKSQLQAMEIELKKLFDTVLSIHEEMFYLRRREEEMQALNTSTNSKIVTFIFLSILVCSFVAALQLWHLKAFFESKKLL